MRKRGVYTIVSIVLAFAIVFSSTIAFANEAPNQERKHVSKIAENIWKSENYAETKEVLTQTKGTSIICSISFSTIKAKTGSPVTIPRIASAVLLLLKKTGLDIHSSQTEIVNLLNKICINARLISLVKAGSKDHGLKFLLDSYDVIALENGIRIQKTRWRIKSIKLY